MPRCSSSRPPRRSISWITPEIFNLSMGVLGLFCGLYRDGQPRGAARQRRWSRFLRGAGGPCLGAAIIGVAAFSKPTNAALAVPIAAAALLRRDWRIAAAASLAFVLSCGGLLRAEPRDQRRGQLPGRRARHLLRGQGLPVHDRGGADSSPLTQTAPTKGGGAVGLTRGVQRAPGDRPLAQQPGRGSPHNLVYFVPAGTADLPASSGVLSVLLFLAWRRANLVPVDHAGRLRRRQRGAAADPAYLLGRRRTDRQPLLHGALPAAALRHAAAPRRAAGDRRLASAACSRRSWC